MYNHVPLPVPFLEICAIPPVFVETAIAVTKNLGPQVFPSMKQQEETRY
jgi:hypothetical protein